MKIASLEEDCNPEDELPNSFSKNTFESLTAASNQYSNFVDTQKNNDCAKKEDTSVMPTRFFEVTLAKKDHSSHDECDNSYSKKE